MIPGFGLNWWVRHHHLLDETSVSSARSWWSKQSHTDLCWPSVALVPTLYRPCVDLVLTSCWPCADLVLTFEQTFVHDDIYQFCWVTNININSLTIDPLWYSKRVCVCVLCVLSFAFVVCVCLCVCVCVFVFCCLPLLALKRYPGSVWACVYTCISWCLLIAVVGFTTSTSSSFAAGAV